MHKEIPHGSARSTKNWKNRSNQKRPRTPNDSETPRDVARQHAQLEVAFEVASVDDTSSGEDSDEEIQWYHCYQDQRRVHYIKKDEAWKKQQENDEQGTDEQSKN
nr:uncharacterized protein CTRU02_09741 [Colletotrichum truncatum]KAF6788423.1 hypothetical protein CTRU02_09741 [Colletotrichum truncatum]